MIYVPEEQLEKMKKEKGDNYNWYTATPSWDSYYNISSENYLMADDKPLALRCLNCGSFFFIDKCDNCEHTNLVFQLHRRHGDETDLDTSLTCLTCGKDSFDWECQKCGTVNPYGKLKPYVKTVKWLMKESKCFIATAVCGSYSAPEVIILRHFRDEILLNNAVGKLFIRFYYFFSPPLADFISNKEMLKKWIRWLLVEPIVKFITFRKKSCNESQQ